VWVRIFDWSFMMQSEDSINLISTSNFVIKCDASNGVTPWNIAGNDTI